MTDKSLHDRDMFSWAMAQADAVRRRSGNEIDWDNVAEELRLLGATEVRELTTRYRVLLCLLLKWAYQPERRGRSWENTIRNQRLELEDHLEANPGLHSVEEARFAKAYALARGDASTETDLPIETFPKDPPFAMADVKRFDWLPEDARP